MLFPLSLSLPCLFRNTSLFLHLLTVSHFISPHSLLSTVLIGVTTPCLSLPAPLPPTSHSLPLTPCPSPSHLSLPPLTPCPSPSHLSLPPTSPSHPTLPFEIFSTKAGLFSAILFFGQELVAQFLLYSS